MESLTHYLETMWKEADRVAMIGYIKSWPKLNAKRKDVKCVLGDHVMLHQPVHIYPEGTVGVGDKLVWTMESDKETRKGLQADAH